MKILCHRPVTSVAGASSCESSLSTWKIPQTCVASICNDSITNQLMIT